MVMLRLVTDLRRWACTGIITVDPGSAYKFGNIPNAPVPSGKMDKYIQSVVPPHGEKPFAVKHKLTPPLAISWLPGV